MFFAFLFLWVAAFFQKCGSERICFFVFLRLCFYRWQRFSKNAVLNVVEGILEKDEKVIFGEKKSKKRKKRTCPTELSEQISFVKVLQKAGLLFCAVPNGGYRHRVEASRLKMGGVKSGVPDVLIFSPAAGFVGAAVELKTSSGLMSQVTDNQRAWLDDLAEKGWFCCVGFGAKDALEKLEKAGWEVGVYAGCEKG